MRAVWQTGPPTKIIRLYDRTSSAAAAAALAGMQNDALRQWNDCIKDYKIVNRQYPLDIVLLATSISSKQRLG